MKEGLSKILELSHLHCLWNEVEFIKKYPQVLQYVTVQITVATITLIVAMVLLEQYIYFSNGKR